MPRGKNHRKRPQAKAKPPQQQKAFATTSACTRAQQEFAVRINNTGENWEALQIHVDFDALYGRLDAAYDEYRDKGPGSYMMLGGIVGIYAKMCVDSILRDKLFQKGVLSKLMPLLDEEPCRRVVLRSLVTMTRHGGIPVKVEIARKTRHIFQVMDGNPSDDTTQELGVAILTHCVGSAVYDVYKPPSPKNLNEISISGVLKTLVRVLKRPGCSAHLVWHALSLIQAATGNCPEEYRKNPSATRFLMALLRSDELSIRCSALGSLLRLHARASEEDRVQFVPAKFMAMSASGNWPPSIRNAMSKYGPTRCDSFVTGQTAREYKFAAMDFLKNRELYTLGKTLAEFALRTEFSIPRGRSEFPEPSALPNLRIMNGRDLGLPVKLWSDMLPLAALSIHEKGGPDEAYLAEVLNLKCLFMRERILEAVAKAQALVKAYPDVAYFYYGASLISEPQLALLERAVEQAGDMALASFQQSRSQQRDHEEDVAFLVSALEDAKKYMAEAPPDARNMKAVIDWYILLTLAIKGKEDALEKLRVNEAILKLLGSRIANTQLRLARVTVLEGYSAAHDEWADLLRVLDEHPDRGTDAYHRKSVDQTKAIDDLATWLEEDVYFGNDDEVEERTADSPAPCDPPQSVTMNTVSLYLCSFCGTPSAALKKCGGCGDTKYCDAFCQKNHWKAHRNHCQRSPK
ncbi:hypothetical protein PUNSTDRAFT_134189 [Punctularia strigosozonata HHB-11173 SS5]|uniref:uncharacterized protein n=1 Tax=Punctularia strigosozonata (strain HHB-11173) TaxID=741275 RepID=UPI0004416AB8|nr:uncharacterized protein PUNSTDRAFT_134189 [Punctularia strigosozonata HHB-11173 SS5]EIN09016.1 hypothetical protein PUNSTDRAFT_134189 [Punctularia strigosozonata HHB-11173 SS5]